MLKSGYWATWNFIYTAGTWQEVTWLIERKLIDRRKDFNQFYKQWNQVWSAAILSEVASAIGKSFLCVEKKCCCFKVTFEL